MAMQQPQRQLTALRPVNTNANEITYATESGNAVTLSPQIVRSYLVNGQGNVTDQEIMMFMKLCQYQGLNPFLREAYLIKYGDDKPATLVTGKEVFTKRAERHPLFRGYEAGIYCVSHENKLMPERNGTMLLPGEKVIGGWARIYREGYEKPLFYSVGFDEYCQYTTDKYSKEKRPTNQWATKPGTMIRKCALVAALREAFPSEFGGMYDQIEINNIDIDSLPQTDVTPTENGIIEPLPSSLGEEQQQVPQVIKMGTRTAEPIDITPDIDERPSCEECGEKVTEKVAGYSQSRFHRTLCLKHQKK